MRAPLVARSFAAPVVLVMLGGSTAAIVSCTSVAVEGTTSDVDSGVDGGPAVVEAGADAVVAPETGTPDAGPPRALDVACKVDPCYVAISGNGARHVCGLLADGTVRCWGRDTMLEATSLADGGVLPADGALGRGAAVPIVEGATPKPVVGVSGVTQISVGPNLGACARTSDGSVYCWGRNDLGQLGRSPSEVVALPTPARVEGLPPVVDVQLGYSTGCAVSVDGALYCWGAWIDGLGVDAGGASSFGPQIVSTFRAPVKALKVGTWTNRDTIIALLDGDVLASLGEVPAGGASFGRPHEIHGVARIGTFGYVTNEGLPMRWRALHAYDTAVGVPATSPLSIPSIAPVVGVDIFGGGASVGTDGPGAILVSTGRLFRWGFNTAGALGVDPGSLLMTPYPLEMPRSGEIVSFATTVESTCIALVSGKVECWGGNAFGELGRGTVDIAAHPQPEEIEQWE